MHHYHQSIFKIKLITLFFFKVIGKSREGSVSDFRILRFFVSEIHQLQMNLITDSQSPLFIVGSCRDRNKCSPDVCGALLHKINIASLSDDQRITTFRWLLEERSLLVNTPLEDLARRMHGFLLGYICYRNCKIHTSRLWF